MHDVQIEFGAGHQILDLIIETDHESAAMTL